MATHVDHVVDAARNPVVAVGVAAAAVAGEVRPREGEAPIIESFLGIKAQGIGVVGMLLNFALTVGVSLATPPPPAEIQSLVEQIRYPRQMTDAELAGPVPSA